MPRKEGGGGKGREADMNTGKGYIDGYSVSYFSTHP